MDGFLYMTQTKRSILIRQIFHICNSCSNSLQYLHISEQNKTQMSNPEHGNDLSAGPSTINTLSPESGLPTRNLNIFNSGQNVPFPGSRFEGPVAALNDECEVTPLYYSISNGTPTIPAELTSWLCTNFTLYESSAELLRHERCRTLTEEEKTILGVLIENHLAIERNEEYHEEELQEQRPTIHIPESPSNMPESTCSYQNAHSNSPPKISTGKYATRSKFNAEVLPLITCIPRWQGEKLVEQRVTSDHHISILCNMTKEGQLLYRDKFGRQNINLPS